MTTKANVDVLQDDIPLSDRVYARLTDRFDAEHHDNRGGFDITYTTGEQVVSRLNEALGPFSWSFEIVAHGYHEEANEFWVHGRLIVFAVPSEGDLRYLANNVAREQFGSQKIKRPSMRNQSATGPAPNRAPLDIGFDLKGATTDALKKCAAALGVGLYLSHKEEKARNDAYIRQDEEREQRRAQAPAGQGAPTTTTAAPKAAPVAATGQPARPQATAPAPVGGKMAAPPATAPAKRTPPQMKAALLSKLAADFQQDEAWLVQEAGRDVDKWCQQTAEYHKVTYADAIYRLWDYIVARLRDDLPIPIIEQVTFPAKAS